MAPVIALLIAGNSGVLPRPMAVGVLVGVLAAVALTLVHRAAQRRWLGAGEVALLAALGLLVPPLAAFGVYFGAWHALRHVARMVGQVPASAGDLARGRALRPLRWSPRSRPR